MKDLRIEIVDAGRGIYIAVDPDGRWARSTELDERVTIDWDGQGRVIGIEAAGYAAQAATEGLFGGLAKAGVTDGQGLDRVLSEIGVPPRAREKSNSTGRSATKGRSSTARAAKGKTGSRAAKKSSKASARTKRGSTPA